MISENVKKGTRLLRRSISKVLPGMKQQLVIPEFTTSDIAIQPLTAEQIEPVIQTFAAWGKTRQQFEKYLAEQERGERVVLIASVGHVVVGYETLIWKSPHEPLARENIPETMDLNVYTAFQNRGIARLLIAQGEKLVEEKGLPSIGITVEQTPQYTVANGLYPRLGYQAFATTPAAKKLHLVKALR